MGEYAESIDIDGVSAGRAMRSSCGGNAACCCVLWFRRGWVWYAHLARNVVLSGAGGCFVLVEAGAGSAK